MAYLSILEKKEFLAMSVEKDLEQNERQTISYQK